MPMSSSRSTEARGSGRTSSRPSASNTPSKVCMSSERGIENAEQLSRWTMSGFSWAKGLSTFRARIFWSVIPIVLVLFALVGAINLRQHRWLVEEQFMKRGQVTASNLAYSSQLGVFAEDKQLLASSIRGVVGDPDVAYVYVYGETGKVLAKGGRQVGEITELGEELSAEENAHLFP